jgi:hypothetical protein
MNKKSKISKKTWWIFGLVGLIYGLTKEDTIWIYIGLVNGLFWGWILGLLFDYIINSLFYREEIEDTSKPTVVQKSKVIVNKPSNHNDYKPKHLEYKTKKETTVVKEPSIAYKPKTNPPKVKQTEKPIKKEKLPIPIKETTREVTNIKYVNYDLKFVESEKDFPIIKIPNKNCVVRSHRIGSTKRRGFKEASFQKAVEYFFAENFKISGNIRLNTGKNTRPLNLICNYALLSF